MKFDYVLLRVLYSFFLDFLTPKMLRERASTVRSSSPSVAWGT